MKRTLQLLHLVVALVVFGTKVCGQYSTSCGNLIAKDGWRYDLTDLQAAGPQQVTYVSNNGESFTIEFSVCGLTRSCGACENAGVCQLPDTCYGEFSLFEMDPLLFGLGAQLRYYGGNIAQTWKQITYLTIMCDPNVDGFAEVEVNGEAPLLSIRMKSQAGCPATAGYPPSFPYQYNFKKYIYSNNPSQGTTEPYNVLDSGAELKREGMKLLDSSDDEHKLYNWGDSDKYHILPCYFIHSDDVAAPFELPLDALYLGTETTTVYDPLSGKYQELLLDEWQYSEEETCFINIWFISGKAIPAKQISCDGETTIYYDFELGQPSGSLFGPPDIKKCYPFQTCSPDWNTCKDPYCCNSTFTCTLCQ